MVYQELTITLDNLNINETLTQIYNVYKVKDISDMLYHMYDNGSIYYNKLDIETKRKIYNSYYEIVNNLDLLNLKEKITGVFYENYKNRYTLKIYNPLDINDDRLLYEPVEITKIGKNNKTTIPVDIEELENIQYDTVDSNEFDVIVIDSNIDDDNPILLYQQVL